jgi:predicted esterase
MESVRDWMSKGTLIMMHGMTGTSEKMEELARGLTPDGWSTLCPQAKIGHPTRGGFAWWLFEEGVSEDESISQMEDSLSGILEIIPDGPIIVGGFSQGGAMASALLETKASSSIVGLVLIATKTARPDELRGVLPFLKPRQVIWMHGERDHLVPLDVGIEHIEIFEESGWPVTRLEHEKGHMVNLNQFEEMREQISEIAKNSQR